MRVNAWQPQATREERIWLEKCPKSVLFVIARQLGAAAAGSCDDLELGFKQVVREWQAQFESGIVPQKPPREFSDVR